jgi:isopentenyl diphosphate isomerase/L-lactate dehydrogenase-like FMN-dependent dehydrogenase
MTQIINIADLRALSKKRLPQAVFGYVDGGADDEITLRENRRAFEEVVFCPRQAISIPNCDLTASVLGNKLSFPALLAPIGYTRLMHPKGELAVARAAGRAGTAYILSTVSGYPLEDVAAATGGPMFYQLYLVGGRAAAEATIERAQAAGYKALVVTIDTAVAGMRERDFRHGMRELVGRGVWGKLPYLPEIMAHPRWLVGYLLDRGMARLPNVVIPGSGPMALADVRAALVNTAVCWDDLRWIRNSWQGPIVLKGVLTPEDARRAVHEGAAAVVVSNHGGRQLDGVAPSLRALPAVVRAINGEAEVLLDSGIRRGSDIVKAICLGARAVLCGRAYIYGLSIGGEAGVTRALEILRGDVERTLRLLGCPSISALDESYVQTPLR